MWCYVDKGNKVVVVRVWGENTLGASEEFWLGLCVCGACSKTCVSGESMLGVSTD